jgi:hypothetical protein
MREKNLATDWFRGTKEDKEKELIKQGILASRPTLDILHQIITNRRESLSRTTEADYSIPGWEGLLAHRNGRKQELDFLDQLLNLT